MTLPFDQQIDIPLSALCEHGIAGMEGHRPKVYYAGRPKLERTLCSRCKQPLVHDRDLSAYVTPFTIEEEPELSW